MAKFHCNIGQATYQVNYKSFEGSDWRNLEPSPLHKVLVMAKTSLNIVFDFIFFLKRVLSRRRKGLPEQLHEILANFCLF